MEGFKIENLSFTPWQGFQVFAEGTTNENGEITYTDTRNYTYSKTYCDGHGMPKWVEVPGQEEEVDGRSVIAVEIYPRMEEFKDTPWEEVEKFFANLLVEVNSTLPTTHRIAKLTVRKEDFKRTGTLKVSRN